MKLTRKIARAVRLMTIVSAFTAAVLLCFVASAVSIPSTAKLGDYIQIGEYFGEPILWRIVSFEKITGYDVNGNPVMDAADTVTEYTDGYLPLVMSDRILCLKAFDASGSNTSGSHANGFNGGSYRRSQGSNDWSDSNIRDWLNSSASAGNVIWTCGNPPDSAHISNANEDNAYANEAGFLSHFSNDEKQMMMTAVQKSLTKQISTDSVSSIINIKDAVSGYASTEYTLVSDKMFLLDVMQTYTVYNNGNVLGSKYFCGIPTQKCVDHSSCSSASLDTTKPWYTLQRTLSDRSNPGSGVFYTSVSGTTCMLNTTPAYYVDLGIRPAFFLYPFASIQNGTGSADDPYELSFEKNVTYAIANGATSVSVSSSTVMLNDPADLTPTATKPGYTFLGWNTDANATTPLTSLIVTDDVTLYPIFVKTVTVSLYAGSKALLESYTLSCYNNDSSVSLTLPAIPSYGNFTAVGWTTADTVSKAAAAETFDAGSTVTLSDDTILYAKYTRTVSFGCDYGEEFDSPVPDTFEQTYLASGDKTAKSYTLAAAPSSDRTFMGYLLNDAQTLASAGTTVTIDTDTVAYAVWQERTETPYISVGDAGDGRKVVTISCAENSSTIYYTLDGTVPSVSSSAYTQPITVSGCENITVKAIAVLSGKARSSVASAAVTLNRLSTPAFDAANGVIVSGTAVALYGASDTVIRYTTDGTEPTAASTVYTAPVTVSEAMTIKAAAFRDGFLTSETATLALTMLDPAKPVYTVTANNNADSTVTVSVALSENAGAAGGSFNLLYDNTAMRVIGYELGTLARSANPTLNTKYNNHAVRLVFAGANAIIGCGELFNVTFAVTDTARTSALFTLEKTKLSDTDAAAIAVQHIDASVVLLETVSDNTQTGDVNGDGEVDFSDALLILRYDAGLATLIETQKKLGDTDGDGEADFADALRILRFSAGLLPSLG